MKRYILIIVFGWLLSSCSGLAPTPKQDANWWDPFYVVDVKSPKSLRLMFKDLGDFVGFGTYSPKWAKIFSKKCNAPAFGGIGHIGWLSGNMRSLCTTGEPFRLMDINRVCSNLKHRFGQPLVYAWRRPKGVFACIKPEITLEEKKL